MSKINLEVAESLDFEEGDCCITIKKDGSIGKVIVPKMNREMLDSDGYKALLDVVKCYNLEQKMNSSSITK